MRFLLASVRKDLFRQLREPVLLFVWMGVPLVVVGLMSLAFLSRGDDVPRVRILVEDEGEVGLGAALVSGVLPSGAPFDRIADLFELEEVEPGAGLSRLEDGDASALVVLPPGLLDRMARGDSAEVDLVVHPVEEVRPKVATEAARAVEQLAFHVVEARRRSGVGEGETISPELVREALAAYAREHPNVFRDPVVELEGGALASEGTLVALLFPGFLLMAVCFMAESLSSDVWEERKRGTLSRALTTPDRAGPLILGKVLAGGTLMLFVGVASAIVGALVYGFDPRHLTLFVVVTSLAGVGFQLAFLALHVHAPTQRAGNVIGSLTLFPLLMVGGSFFPFEVMPPWLAAVGRSTPNGWLLDRLRTVAFEDAALGSLVPPIAALALLASVLAWTAIRRLPRFVLP